MTFDGSSQIVCSPANSTFPIKSLGGWQIFEKFGIRTVGSQGVLKCLARPAAFEGCGPVSDASNFAVVISLPVLELYHQ